jgi:hypothetical protein
MDIDLLIIGVIDGFFDHKPELARIVAITHQQARHS